MNKTARQKISTLRYDAPCGQLLLGCSGAALCLCDWIDRHVEAEVNDCADSVCRELLKATASQLDEYFAGTRREFDLPLKMEGTEFQREVWHTLLTIPYGATISYRQLASLTGRPKAIRAVANAVGANPMSIIVPCHRVIGSDGSLTGYAGGLTAKRFLLDLENTRPSIFLTGT